MIADEVAPCRGLCELSFPLEEGIVKNWDDMEMIWEYGFKKVKILFIHYYFKVECRYQWSHSIYD